VAHSCYFHITAQSKQLLFGRKFARSGHLDQRYLVRADSLVIKNDLGGPFEKET
jgi:hypothetical protein